MHLNNRFRILLEFKPVFHCHSPSRAIGPLPSWEASLTVVVMADFPAVGGRGHHRKSCIMNEWMRVGLRKKFEVHKLVGKVKESFSENYGPKYHLFLRDYGKNADRGQFWRPEEGIFSIIPRKMWYFNIIPMVLPVLPPFPAIMPWFVNFKIPFK